MLRYMHSRDPSFWCLHIQTHDTIVVHTYVEGYTYNLLRMFSEELLQKIKRVASKLKFANS